MNDKTELSVLGFSFNQDKTGAYGLVLAEVGGLRRLMIVIGTPEAQSIAFSLQASPPPRPLTHDIFHELLVKFNITLKEVYIYKYENGVFFSQLILESVTGEEVIIESRTSDAVGLALRSQAPIYANEEIMVDLSIVLDDSPKSINTEEDIDKNMELDYSLLNESELKNLLKAAIKDEDYELASLIRDELRNR